MARAITLIVETALREAEYITPAVEQIQDKVETALMKCGYQKTAKAYILYRSQHQKARDTKNTLLDYKKLVNGYIGENKDWRVKENSTVTLSVGGLILSNSGAITANYWLSEVYDDEIAQAHRQCFLHLHDLSMLTGYCAGWSLKQLLQDGLGGVPDRITSSPAKHLSTLCNQMVNFLGIMQNEWAGAQAFSSFDTYLAPFVKADHLSYAEVKQCIQSFIYGVNTPSRWGTQAPFTNVTLDWTVPDDLKDQPAIVGGKPMDFTYGDCKKEMDMVNKAFIEIMIEGDANGRGFQYPIPTYSITKDFDWSDTENNRLLFEMTAKYGTPYFSNYINSDMKPSDVRSMCCRLRLDLRELRKKGGGYFGSGESTGSIGVVTLNLPRMAYLSKTREDFFRMLDKYMDIAARSLSIKRKVITRLMEEGLYPYTRRYLGTFKNHFSTIGLVGMNEALLNAKWMDHHDITTEEGRAESIAILKHMRARLSDYQEQYGDLYNLEATPAESTTYRFAKHDREEFPDIITAAKDGNAPYYTNSTHLPVGYTDDIFDALEMEDEMQTLYTSGTVFHAFLGERLPHVEIRGGTGEKDRGKLPPPLFHPLSDLLRLRGARLHRRRTFHLPAVRQARGSLFPHHRLLPPGEELERWQGLRIQEPQDLRSGHHQQGRFPALPGMRAEETGCGSCAGRNAPQGRRAARRCRDHSPHHQDLPELPHGQADALRCRHPLPSALCRGSGRCPGRPDL